MSWTTTAKEQITRPSRTDSMSALRVVPLALLAVAASAVSQQQPLVLKAGTPVTISNQRQFSPADAHLGDTLDFTTSFPVRVGKVAVIPKGTVLHGRVTALKPQVEITLDPLQIAGSTVALSGHPFQVKGARRDDTPGTPPEFAWHYQFTTKERFELIGGVIVLSPIIVATAAVVVVVVAVALPFYAVHYLTHPHNHGRKNAFTRSLVTLASDTSFNPTELPGPKPYSGLPIVYVVDHYRTDHGELLCNNQPFFAKAFSQQIVLRVPAQTYTFSATEAGQTSATVDARPDGRYLVYRDKLGLHAENLADRPELLEQGTLTGEDKSDKFFFDYTKVPANQQTTLDEQRSKGGCGLAPILHTRPPKPDPASAP